MCLFALNLFVSSISKIKMCYSSNICKWSGRFCFTFTSFISSFPANTVLPRFDIHQIHSDSNSQQINEFDMKKPIVLLYKFFSLFQFFFVLPWKVFLNFSTSSSIPRDFIMIFLEFKYNFFINNSVFIIILNSYD